jgi:hypothetical protein
MGRHNLNRDQEAVIRNALADRGDHLDGLIYEWHQNPAHANPDDVAATEYELEVLRGLQSSNFPIPGQG